MKLGDAVKTKVAHLTISGQYIPGGLIGKVVGYEIASTLWKIEFEPEVIRYYLESELEVIK